MSVNVSVRTGRYRPIHDAAGNFIGPPPGGDPVARDAPPPDDDQMSDKTDPFMPDVVRTESPPPEDAGRAPRAGEFASERNAVANRLRGLSRFKNVERLDGGWISLVIGDEIPLLVFVELGGGFPAEPPEVYVVVRSGAERLLLEIGGFAFYLYSSMDYGLARWVAIKKPAWGARDTVADLLQLWEEALREAASAARLPEKTGEHYELAVPEEFVRGERAGFKTRGLPPERGARPPARASKRARAPDADIRRAMERVSRCWQRQIPVERLCGMHAVHSLLCVLLGWLDAPARLPKSVFDGEVAAFAMELGQPEDLIKDASGYTVDFVHHMLQKYLLGFDVRPFYGPYLVTENCRAVVVGTGEHYFALVKEGESWFDMDSLSRKQYSKVCDMSSNVRYLPGGDRRRGANRRKKHYVHRNLRKSGRRGGRSRLAGVTLLGARPGCKRIAGSRGRALRGSRGAESGDSSRRSGGPGDYKRIAGS